MTTIVVDRKVGLIAADRRHTGNEWSTIQEGMIKVRTASIRGKTHYMASSGYEPTGKMAEEWYARGSRQRQPDPIDVDEDTKFLTIILTPDGRILELDRYLKPFEVPHRFAATGSGGGFALAVLEAGCGIEKAMRTAIKLDGGSGYPFDVFYLSGEHEVFEE